MATVRIIKNVRQQAVVKFLGPGSATLDLASLANLNQSANVSFDRANSKVSIQAMWSSANGFVTVSRGSNTILKVSDGPMNWDFAQSMGVVDDDSKNANFTVSFVNDGTVIMSLSKPAGYNYPNTQNTPGG
jgi:hypothetical protein